MFYYRLGSMKTLTLVVLLVEVSEFASTIVVLRSRLIIIEDDLIGFIIVVVIIVEQHK